MNVSNGSKSVKSSPPDERGSDARREARNSSLRAGDITYENLRVPIACLVENLSEDGFGIIVDSPLTFPDRIQLTLSHPCEQFACEVVWRREAQLGVRIIR